MLGGGRKENNGGKCSAGFGGAALPGGYLQKGYLRKTTEATPALGRKYERIILHSEDKTGRERPGTEDYRSINSAARKAFFSQRTHTKGDLKPESYERD